MSDENLSRDRPFIQLSDKAWQLSAFCGKTPRVSALYPYRLLQGNADFT